MSRISGNIDLGLGVVNTGEAGFTVSKENGHDGLYRITFLTPFKAEPAVSVQPINTEPMRGAYAIGITVSTAYIIVKLALNGQYADAPFSFTAFGPLV